MLPPYQSRLQRLSSAILQASLCSTTLSTPPAMAAAHSSALHVTLAIPWGCTRILLPWSVISIKDAHKSMHALLSMRLGCPNCCECILKFSSQITLARQVARVNGPPRSLSMCSCILAVVMGTLRGLGTSQWTMGPSRGTASSTGVLGHTQVHLDPHAQWTFQYGGPSQQLFKRFPPKTMVI